ncbi:MFS general substrate transporter [Phanerochaete sordida]|uniref:MFS general substrate transporter n=1 Tax=Phanerochaete sordida TaxID=48140 RepID=A0A9P3GEX5_9APHY|nr:MFS general substrate transporter [Phanerochaete sordida]
MERTSTTSVSDLPAAAHDANTSQDTLRDLPPRKGLQFWSVFVALCVCLFLSALEYTAVSTALPTIVHDLHGGDFVWIGSAYALAATAFLPAIGGLAEVFGRRTSMLISQAIFVLGSALCGAATNMSWLIAARAIQGAGSSGLLAVTNIIISDLVPLSERAMYTALVSLTWGIAAAVGPVVGGAFAQHGQWRWLFYMNLPITGVAIVLVAVFLKLPTPGGSFTDKLGRMDWIGNFLIIAASSSCVIGLTWAGVEYSWTSTQVLVPLIVGLVGIVGFFVYEATLAKEPLVPFTLISNRTVLSGYIQTFICYLVSMTTIYFLPVYYQTCLNASPTLSGMELFGLVIPLLPALILTAIAIKTTGSYRVPLWIAWVLGVAGLGVMSIIKADSPASLSIGLPILLGVSCGILSTATYFPVLAPLPVTENAHALSLLAFFRSFAGVWGITIGTAVLQTQLTKRLPSDFIAQVPGGVSLAFSLIPVVPTLSEPFRDEVKVAFAESLATIWQVTAGIGAIGLFASLAMEGLPLTSEVDSKWALDKAVRVQAAAKCDDVERVAGKQ